MDDVEAACALCLPACYLYAIKGRLAVPCLPMLCALPPPHDTLLAVREESMHQF